MSDLIKIHSVVCGVLPERCDNVMRSSPRTNAEAVVSFGGLC
jgi:hypothetical protein